MESINESYQGICKQVQRLNKKKISWKHESWKKVWEICSILSSFTKFSYITFDKQGLIYPISTFLFQGANSMKENFNLEQLWDKLKTKTKLANKPFGGPTLGEFKYKGKMKENEQ